MKRAFLIFVLVLAMAVPVMAADTDLAKKSTLQSILKAGKLRVGMEPGYMPFEMQDKQSRIVGFDVDMAKIMAKEMGVELELVPTAWDGIIGSLLTDKFDIIMSGMTVTQQRNMKVNFVDPYIIVGQTILINKKHYINLITFLALLASLTFLSGCAELGLEGSDSDMEASAEASDVVVENQPYYPTDFKDLLIPSELDWNRGNSMAIRTDSFAGGILNFSGRVEANSLSG